MFEVVQVVDDRNAVVEKTEILQLAKCRQAFDLLDIVERQV